MALGTQDSWLSLGDSEAKQMVISAEGTRTTNTL